MQRLCMLGGWTWSEMALLLSFHLLTYSAGASLSFTQFRVMDDMVRLNTMDAILVKLISPWTYLVFSGLNISYTSHVILVVGLMGWAMIQVDVARSVSAILFFLASLLSGPLIVCSPMTMIGASALVWVRSRHLYSIFFGFWELARYPMVIPSCPSNSC
ncbi:MAG: ABC transporter permease [Candidatus Devosia symbiotica]|nr:ABC transporter permease [Candidatus Devosia symbiotica]